MNKPRSFTAAAAMVEGFAVTVAWAMHASSSASDNDATTAAQPALTVTVTTLRPAMLPIRIAANGNVMAWQEASIGTEANGLRLASVEVNVGDVVQRGQVLVSFASDTVSAELAQSRGQRAARPRATNDRGDGDAADPTVPHGGAYRAGPAGSGASRREHTATPFDGVL